MPAGMPAGSSGGASVNPELAARIAATAQMAVSAAAIPGAVPNAALNHVKLEKSAFTMKPGESVTVKISSDAEDSRNLLVLPDGAPGVQGAFDSNSLKPGGSVVLTLKAGPDLRAGTVQVVVVDTGETMPIQISVAK
jgi:hypothetical protein